MNVLDILLLVAAVWFAVVGFRQGFVVGILSVIGFLGGGLIAVYTLPVIWDALTDNSEVGTTAAVVAVVVVIVCASVGQALTTHLGNKLRRYITWSPARALDATGGALVNVVAMLLVAWLIGSALAGTTLPTLGKEVRQSKVLLGVSRALPDQADIWFADFSSVLAQNGFPQVFSPFANEPITDVRPPDPALAGSPVAARAQRSIVKVTGTATSCGKVLEGTGFVFDDRRVMTNAHVVGGVDEPVVQIGGEGRTYDATVVLYDWKRDIAVLDVPDLDAPVLRFAAEDASSGDGAIVAGFPENGAYDVRAARLRGRITANGPDIYHRGTVRRDVYSLYATVRQGNSGGPLLTPQGEVYGVIFAKSLDDDRTGYALTVDEIREDIARGRSAAQEVDSDKCAL
ncbi:MULTISPECIES: MarP family serine protease [Streptomyces]|uniref:MarP family serine protease n=2 Tax=Streptomyces TaxID=1883 RepID=A0ABU3J5M2_9ACTN|nr:MarP family serine protease [Streptomyces sp. McG7]MBT2907522.1 MarP family serine protease [Streptomyces sp. McG8]MDQ0486780.1 S1-C subfamily serine protease [Streptomyces thermodiastaticus]MDT6970360.1 MarP family serine protease [Streptomyces thermocarboxydus]MDX3414772.1 MarP family serine protease [Streptomyces sp. MD20-1-1]MXQ62064.1 MarP family serine protease [Streptomyces sp. XHT-2]MYQ31967.1 MarP family serine protease [Streptomyces sp. SID4956]MYW55619.1 MarP family serine prot